MCYLLKKYFWWLLRRVKNLRSTACKHYRKCDVIYRYLHIELIWCLLMVQYLQNNVIMKWTTRFIRFTGWIPLKYGSTTTSPIIAHCQTRQIWGIWKLRPAYSPETINLGQNRWCFVPCDLEIWWMTLENDRASLLCCFKLCATFHSHWWIQTGVTVRKRPIWVKFDDF